MSITFYMDVHIKRAITEGLRRTGIDVLTAQEDGCGHLSDAELLDRASSLGRVLVSMDDDLLTEANADKLKTLLLPVSFTPSASYHDWTGD